MKSRMSRGSDGGMLYAEPRTNDVELKRGGEKTAAALGFVLGKRSMTDRRRRLSEQAKRASFRRRTDHQQTQVGKRSEKRVGHRPRED